MHQGNAVSPIITQLSFGSNTLDRLLDQDSALGSSTKELGWRGAEAYHFYMLAQRQLFEGSPQQIEAAMRTALRCENRFVW